MCSFTTHEPSVNVHITIYNHLFYFCVAEVSIFLRETLNTEKLSDHAESCRKKLLQKLDFREASPQAYIDMNGPTKGRVNYKQHMLMYIMLINFI